MGPVNNGVSQSLTLLFGMPRSGTTWIAKIFDSHPDTLYRHEPDSDGSLNAVPFYPKVDQWEKHRGAVQAFVRDLLAINSSRVAGSLPIFRKNYCSNMRLMFQRAAIMATRATEQFGWELPIPAIADQATRVHVVWKSIESTGRLGLIARALPECRAILILRHPCAYIASVLSGESQQRFTDSAPASEDYEIFEWLLAASRRGSNHPSLDVLKALQPVERLAWLWVLTNEKALDDIAGMENCAYVRYEDVCAEPFAMAWEMLNFAGLLWDEQVKSFIHQSTSRHSDRYYSVFKDPAVAANQWRSSLSPDNIERILSIVHGSRLRNLYSETPLNGSPSRTSTTRSVSDRGVVARGPGPGSPVTLPENGASVKTYNGLVPAKIYPPSPDMGFCVWLTGLSGAGKSTISEALTTLLVERGRRVTVLDGDVVRTHLSKGLGFSREDRDTNIRRIGFVAAEITRHGGAVISAAVSPYQVTRNEVRAMIGGDRFLLVFVDTPLEECERRDPKGLYAKARQGQVKNFTGLDDPYERPADADLVLDTTHSSPADNALEIVAQLSRRGLLAQESDAAQTANAPRLKEPADSSGGRSTLEQR
jgi:adenylyl-sulfate kinase